MPSSAFLPWTSGLALSHRHLHALLSWLVSRHNMDVAPAPDARPGHEAPLPAQGLTFADLEALLSGSVGASGTPAATRPSAPPRVHAALRFAHGLGATAGLPPIPTARRVAHDWTATAGIGPTLTRTGGDQQDADGLQGESMPPEGPGGARTRRDTGRMPAIRPPAQMVRSPLVARVLTAASNDATSGGGALGAPREQLDAPAPLMWPASAMEADRIGRRHAESAPLRLPAWRPTFLSAEDLLTASASNEPETTPQPGGPAPASYPSITAAATMAHPSTTAAVPMSSPSVIAPAPAYLSIAVPVPAYPSIAVPSTVAYPQSKALVTAIGPRSEAPVTAPPGPFDVQPAIERTAGARAATLDRRPVRSPRRAADSAGHGAGAATPDVSRMVAGIGVVDARSGIGEAAARSGIGEAAARRHIGAPTFALRRDVFFTPATLSRDVLFVPGAAGSRRPDSSSAPGQALARTFRPPVAAPGGVLVTDRPVGLNPSTREGAASTANAGSAAPWAPRAWPAAYTPRMSRAWPAAFMAGLASNLSETDTRTPRAAPWPQRAWRASLPGAVTGSAALERTVTASTALERAVTGSYGILPAPVAGLRSAASRQSAFAPLQTVRAERALPPLFMPAPLPVAWPHHLAAPFDLIAPSAEMAERMPVRGPSVATAPLVPPPLVLMEGYGGQREEAQSFGALSRTLALVARLQRAPGTLSSLAHAAVSGHSRPPLGGALWVGPRFMPRVAQGEDQSAIPAVSARRSAIPALSRQRSAVSAPSAGSGVARLAGEPERGHVWSSWQQVLGGETAGNVPIPERAWRSGRNLAVSRRIRAGREVMGERPDAPAAAWSPAEVGTAARIVASADAASYGARAAPTLVPPSRLMPAPIARFAEALVARLDTLPMGIMDITAPRIPAVARVPRLMPQWPGSARGSGARAEIIALVVPEKPATARGPRERGGQRTGTAVPRYFSPHVLAVAHPASIPALAVVRSVPAPVPTLPHSASVPAQAPLHAALSAHVPPARQESALAPAPLRPFPVPIPRALPLAPLLRMGLASAVVTAPRAPAAAAFRTPGRGISTPEQGIDATRALFPSSAATAAAVTAALARPVVRGEEGRDVATGRPLVAPITYPAPPGAGLVTPVQARIERRAEAVAPFTALSRSMGGMSWSRRMVSLGAITPLSPAADAATQAGGGAARPGLSLLATQAARFDAPWAARPEQARSVGAPGALTGSAGIQPASVAGAGLAGSRRSPFALLRTVMRAVAPVMRLSAAHDLSRDAGIAGMGADARQGGPRGWGVAPRALAEYGLVRGSLGVSDAGDRLEVGGPRGVTRDRLVASGPRGVTWDWLVFGGPRETTTGEGLDARAPRIGDRLEAGAPRPSGVFRPRITPLLRANENVAEAAALVAASAAGRDTRPAGSGSAAVRGTAHVPALFARFLPPVSTPAAALTLARGVWTPPLSRPLTTAATTARPLPLLQRKALPGAGEPGPLQRSLAVELTAHSAGRPLDAPARVLMQTVLARDFGPVQLHTDAPAGQAAAAVGARAFTLGRDVYFAPGAYQPHTPAGLALLGHELVHTGQQQAAVQRYGAAGLDAISAADEPPSLEAQAARAESALLTLFSPGSVSVARQAAADAPTGPVAGALSLPTHTAAPAPLAMDATPRALYHQPLAAVQRAPTMFGAVTPTARVAPPPGRAPFLGAARSAVDGTTRGSNGATSHAWVSARPRQSMAPAEEPAEQPEAAQAAMPAVDDLVAQVLRRLKQELRLDHERAGGFLSDMMR